MLKVVYRQFLIISCLFILLLSGGCSWVGEAVNPYKSSFACPLDNNGKCIRMTDAYKESLQPEGTPQSLVRSENAGSSSSETVYQDSLYRKLTGLLDEPTTPVIAPPKVMRMLLLPYKGSDKELYLYRYVFFVVDDYSWTLGDNIYIGDN